MSGLELLRLHPAVDRAEDRHDAADDAACGESGDPDDDRNDPLRLLSGDDVADTSEQKKVEDQNDDRILRRLRRVDEIAAAGAAARSVRWWWSRRGVGIARCVHLHFLRNVSE